MTTKEQQQLCDPRYGKTGQCIAPEIVRHEDKRYNPPRYVFTFLCNGKYPLDAGRRGVL